MIEGDADFNSILESSKQYSQIFPVVFVLVKVPLFAQQIKYNSSIFITLFFMVCP